RSGAVGARISRRRDRAAGDWRQSDVGRYPPRRPEKRLKVTDPDPILRVDNLAISYRVEGRWLRAVDDVHLTVEAGQIVGLVGESGSGKSTIAAGILRYLPPNGRIEPGSRLALAGDDLIGRSRRSMQRIWGARMGFVPQDASAALNPSLKVG